MDKDLEQKKADKMKQLKALEDEQERIENEIENEMKLAAEKDLKRIAKRKELESKKLENEMNNKIRSGILFCFNFLSIKDKV